MSSLISFVNEEMDRVSHLVSSIRLWIILMKPKIEDGNNFGVSVQEEYIRMLDGLERALSNVMGGSLSYYIDRGKYLKNVDLVGVCEPRFANTPTTRTINGPCCTTTSFTCSSAGSTCMKFATRSRWYLI